jgi:hypothetical protein
MDDSGWSGEDRSTTLDNVANPPSVVVERWSAECSDKLRRLQWRRKEWMSKSISRSPKHQDRITKLPVVGVVGRSFLEQRRGSAGSGARAITSVRIVYR